jgi:hypothetical protein
VASRSATSRAVETREFIASYIGTLNTHLNRQEQIKKFAIIDRELSIEAADLTPNLKLRCRCPLSMMSPTDCRSYTASER